MKLNLIYIILIILMILFLKKKYNIKNNIEKYNNIDKNLNPLKWKLFLQNNGWFDQNNPEIYQYNNKKWID